MSHAINDSLLESIFEETLAELYIDFKDVIISRKELEEMAEKLTYQRFEDLN